MTIRQISVFVENKPGHLHEIIQILGEAKVDIRALSLADTTNFGILRLIVDDPDKAERVLSDHDFSVSITDVVGIRVSDKPGGLEKPLRVLLNAGIAVEYAYAFIGNTDQLASVILRVQDNQTAIAVLKENGIASIQDFG